MFIHEIKSQHDVTFVWHGSTLTAQIAKQTIVWLDNTIEKSHKCLQTFKGYLHQNFYKRAAVWATTSESESDEKVCRI